MEEFHIPCCIKKCEVSHKRGVPISPRVLIMPLIPLYLEIRSYYHGVISVSYVKFYEKYNETIKFKIISAAFAENANLILKYKNNLSGNTSDQKQYFSGFFGLFSSKDTYQYISYVYSL